MTRFEVQDAFNNRSKLALILRSQSMLVALNQINNKLTDLENSLDHVGMIGDLLETKFGYMEERFDRQNVRMEGLLMALSRALRPRSDPRAVELLRRGLESVPSDDVQGASGNRNFSSEESVSEFYLSSGKSMYKDNDFNQAARYLRGAYTNGKWEAAYYLGKLYYNGYGVTKSYEKAFQFYQIGAKYDDMASTYELAECIGRGQSTKLDSPLAQYYFRKASDAGYAKTMGNQGCNLLHGTHAKQNWPKAYRLLTMAVEAGDREAGAHLALCYQFGSMVDRDMKKVFEISQEAFLSNVEYSELLLGNCYMNGVGTEQNFEKAAELYRKAFEKETTDRKSLQGDYGICLI